MNPSIVDPLLWIHYCGSIIVDPSIVHPSIVDPSIVDASIVADQRNIFQTNAHKYVTDAHKKGTGLIHAATGARDVVRKGIIHRHALDSVRNATQICHNLILP